MKSKLQMPLLVFFSLSLNPILNSILSSTALADINGNPAVAIGQCSGLFSLADTICNLIKNSGVTSDGQCKVTANTCADGEQELFTGNTTELATPINIKNWTGFGGATAEKYQQAHLCLLRDLKDQVMTTNASAQTDLGSVGFKQVIQMKKFDRENLEWTGYHRGRACAPAIGCIDIFNQKITVKALSSDVSGLGFKAGEYKILKSHGMSVRTDSVAQGFAASVKAISVKTPYGEVSASPEFSFGRATGFILAPFDSKNTKTTLDIPNFGKAKLWDVYGRNPGTKITQLAPVYFLSGGKSIDINPFGYISQVAFGSRTASPKGPFWTAPNGIEYPDRPDQDFKISRSKLEGIPNAYLGAAVKIQYSPTELLPPAIKNNNFINVSFLVWAKPLIESGFTSQFMMNHAEVSKGNKLAGPNGPINYLVTNMDQFKMAGFRSASSTSIRTALDAGVDLTLHLHVPIPAPFIDDIDITLIDIHPTTTITEKSVTGNAESLNGSLAITKASEALSSGRWFQTYVSPKGNIGSAKADQHISQCLAAPTAELPDPPAPGYQPGNPQDLTKLAKYPCNICYGFETVTYKDENGVTQTVQGFLKQDFPVSQGNKPSNVRWICNDVKKSGCYDMCTYDAQKDQLTVFETAVEMINAGKAKKMPVRCNF